MAECLTTFCHTFVNLKSNTIMKKPRDKYKKDI